MGCGWTSLSAWLVWCKAVSKAGQCSLQLSVEVSLIR